MKNNFSKFIMKLIKKIRLIDYLALLILTVLCSLLLFRLKRTAESVYIELTFERNYVAGSQLVPPEYWELNKLQVQDPILNNMGEKVGVIEDISALPWGGGQRRYTRILVSLESLKTLNPGTYTFEGSPVFVGSEMTLNTGQEQFTGTILNIFHKYEDRYQGFEKAEAVVKVKARLYEKWVADAFKEFILVDNQGKKTAEILELNSHPAEIVTNDLQGRVVLSYHPYLQDIEATFKLYDVLCQDSSCYFNDFFTFLIGDEFWIDNGTVFMGKNTSIMSVEIIKDN